VPPLAPTRPFNLRNPTNETSERGTAEGRSPRPSDTFLPIGQWDPERPRHVPRCGQAAVQLGSGVPASGGRALSPSNYLIPENFF
jgi:hypothetical protein